jgi:hypothetical protein
MDPISFSVGVIIGVMIAVFFDNLFYALNEDKQTHESCVWIAPSDYEIKAVKLPDGTLVIYDKDEIWKGED